MNKTETVVSNKVEETTKKAERKDSFTYALKSLKTLTEKAERNQWITNEELEKLKEVYKKMVERFVGLELI